MIKTILFICALALLGMGPMAIMGVLLLMIIAFAD